MALTFDEDLLLSILSQPTVPFKEGHVIRRIREVLDQSAVPYFTDRVGNLVLGVASEAEYRKLFKIKSTEPVRIFVAHLDHPGFHGAEWVGDGQARLAVKWHGGTPYQELEGAPVWLADAEGWAGEGVIRNAVLASHGRAIAISEVEVTQLNRPATAASSLWGAFRFRAPAWKEGSLLYTKAADDLVGSFAIVSLARELFKRRKKPSTQGPPAGNTHPPFIGLLTRGEEVGFIGAIGHLELALYEGARRPVLAVSLETSRTLPGADIGKGPIVRLGDRVSIFSPGATEVLTGLARKLLPGAYQRRIMDGGSCEGTATTAYGLPTIAMSVPLGNYHNQSLEGGPDSRGPDGPAPEFVHLDDVRGLLLLCQAVMKPNLPWDRPWVTHRKEMKKRLQGARALLRSGP